jgi:hypothetical protein
MRVEVDAPIRTKASSLSRKKSRGLSEGSACAPGGYGPVTHRIAPLKKGPFIGKGDLIGVYAPCILHAWPPRPSP